VEERDGTHLLKVFEAESEKRLTCAATPSLFYTGTGTN
jgi:hypothetical protein